VGLSVSEGEDIPVLCFDSRALCGLARQSADGRSDAEGIVFPGMPLFFMFIESDYLFGRIIVNCPINFKQEYDHF